jgi:hypothetical protein
MGDMTVTVDALKETAPGETRVAVTPASVQRPRATSLSDHPTARSVLRAFGVDGSATYPKALAVLAGSHMLVRAS